MSLIARNWNRRLKAKIQRTFRRQLVLPRAREAPRHRLPAQAQRAPLVVQQQRRLARAANRDGCLRVPGRLQGDRLHHLSAANPAGPADDRNRPARRQRRGDMPRVHRLRHLNAANMKADPANGRNRPARQVVPLWRRARQVSGLHRHRENLVDRQKVDRARDRLRAALVLATFRHKAAQEDPKSEPALLLRLRAQVSTNVAAGSDHQQRVRPRRLPVRFRGRREARREKEVKRLMVSRAARQKVARPPEPSATKDNPKVEKENRQKNLHRPDPKNSSVIAMMAPEREVPEPFLLRMYERCSEVSLAIVMIESAGAAAHS
jgi:hypothetical protein